MKRERLGILVVTASIEAAKENNPRFCYDVQRAFHRYIHEDWGECCKEDAEANDRAVNGEDRIFAAYETCEGRIWIITEWDSSATTILFPSDY